MRMASSYKTLSPRMKVVAIFWLQHMKRVKQA
uniref:Uncharacterized protein n=1 Tax=Anguilla anguilla TaxID=7936 RepID=A0A0E9QVL7_ANGAN